MEAARTSLREEKGPVRRRRGPSGCAVCYRMRPEDDPPRLVVTVVMDTEQMLRMRLFWIVSPDSSTAQCVLYLTPDWIEGSSRPGHLTPRPRVPASTVGIMRSAVHWKPLETLRPAATTLHNAQLGIIGVMWCST